MTSIETYASKSHDLITKHLDGDITTRELLTMHHNLYYEIEELHKQEIIDAATWGTLHETPEKYYQEKFKKQ